MIEDPQHRVKQLALRDKLDELLKDLTEDNGLTPRERGYISEKLHQARWIITKVEYGRNQTPRQRR